MIFFQENTDATSIYRETSALRTVRLDGTGDTGCLLSIIRDAVVIVGPSDPFQSSVKVPDDVRGSVDAISS
jgi:hypothetical protein